MDSIKEIISSTKIGSIADYVNLYKDIGQKIKKKQLKDAKSIKIALLSSFTTKGIKEILFVKCCEINCVPELYIGEYSQYSQEILGRNSGLYGFKPNLIIIFIDAMEILGEQYFSPYQISDKKRKHIQ